MTETEQLSLIDALLDGVISEADLIRLEAEMLVDPAARERYYQRLALDTVLAQELEALEAPTNVVPMPRAPRLTPGWAVAALSMAALIVMALVWRPEGKVAERVASGYGVIVEEIDAVWSDGQGFSRGDLLPGGPLTLASGLVKVELFSGVVVILEGEAAFEIRSPMEMAMTKGHLQADVPEPAQGFRVETAAGEIVDLGTTFSVDVTGESAEVSVLSGEIEWHGISQPKRSLTSGQGVRAEAGGIVSDLDAGPRQDLETMISESRARDRAAWLEKSEALAIDPRVIAYFPRLGEGFDRRDLADATGQLKGAVVLADAVTDRWGQKDGALDFSPMGSRVRMQVPGEYRSLTLACWVRIDQLDRWFNSLFLTDGHELHEPHWQIMDDGRLFFSVKAHDTRKDKHIAYSPTIWTPEQSGEWMHLAVIYDGDAATTTHLVNGDVVSVDVIPEAMRIDAVRIGAASIGNWSDAKRMDPDFAVRNLNGAIDEFVLFGEALSVGELAELYQTGKP